jgi:phospholipase C
MGTLDNIDHVVVLMLENRSFDSMLGALYPKSPGFDGLAGDEFNLDATGNPVPVWNSPGADRQTLSIPDPDPGELWTDINTQIFEVATGPSPVRAPSMGGFARNYAIQTDQAGADYAPKKVMHHFTPEQVPVISALARQFAVSDRWFASAPCQTWPNRFFVHTGTADRHENNNPPHLPGIDTIFNRFELAGNESWKIYFHDIAQSKTLTRLWLLRDHFHFYEQFQLDAKNGTLPAYSFIEPRYFTDLALPNDQHPPHAVTLGEQLIADVYNHLRNGPDWTKTLLIITYDEHGGCYDHVPPPAAVSPEAPIAGQAFKFDRYGVRVPAVIVSPFVQQGTVLRPPGDVPFDHTSILATLRTRFSLGAPLTARDANAPDLAGALTLSAPINLGPQRLDALPFAATPVEVANNQMKPLNSNQAALVTLAARLPDTQAPASVPAISIAAAALKTPPLAAVQDNVSAISFVKARVGEFFRSG